MSSINSRQDILNRIRRKPVADAPLPDLNQAWITYPDRERQFIEVLTFVGGQSRIVENRTQLGAVVAELPCMQNATKTVCTVSGAGDGNCDLAAIGDPHELHDVDVAILPGEFGVAENGAIWVNDQHLRHRAIYFIAQHLVLVLPRADILDNLHQAYARLRFDAAGYGLFISGPSKTADIEQSLVVGAHGPRSLTVLLVGP